MNIHFLAIFLVFLLSIQKIQNGNSLPANLNTTSLANSKNIIKNNSTKTQDNLQVKQCNVSYMKIGCYLDPNIENSSFPSLILKPILPLLNESKTWSVRGEPWDTFLQDFVCSCAQRTKQLKYNYFGLKRFDQCWSGDTTLYYRNPQSTGCLQSEMNSCDARSTSPCAGNSTSVFVYRL